MKKVDTHAHVFDVEGPVVGNARYRPSYTASVAQFIQHLDQNGYSYGVLIQPSFFGYDNSQMLSAIAAYPDRLKGVAVVPMEVSLAELQSLQKQGIVGARLNLFGKPLPDVESITWQHFLANLTALNWQLELHCPPAYLSQMMIALQGFPGPIVLDHFGRVDPQEGVVDPDYQMALELLDPARYWVKISGYYRLGDEETGLLHAQQALGLLLQKNMQDRLIWGSDWPHTQHEQEISYNQAHNAMHKLITDPDLLNKVLSQNALSLFNFEPE